MEAAKRYTTKMYRTRHTAKPVTLVLDPDTKRWVVVDMSKQKSYATKKEAMLKAG